MANIILQTENFASNLLVTQLDSSFLYHNLRHTQRVVKSTKELVDFYQLNDKESEAIILAAWLHDIGYVKGADKHEENSILLAREFLTEQEYDAELIDLVCKCIFSTKHNVKAVTLLEKILYDADCSHFAKKSYINISNMLREEWERLGIKTLSEQEWIEENINFFTKGHNFTTDYAIKNWQGNKEDNLVKLFSLLKKAKKETVSLAKKEKELSLKIEKANTPERGIETMFRVTLRNHTALSDIADTKANILLSVNAIIISLVLSNLLPKLDNKSNEHLIYPTLIFVIFSVASMVLSVLATRPNVTSGKFKKEDVKNKKVNLLFFGNFHKMGLDEFEWAISELMKDKDYLYSTLTKDLYFLGKVLDRKYKILRVTYTVFLIGIILSVICFIVAFKFYA